MKVQLVIFSLLLISVSSMPSICQSISDKNDRTFEGSSPLQKTKACFVYLIEKGEYQSIDQLEQSLNDEEQKIMTQLLKEEIIRLQSIQQYVIQSKTTCEPVLKWAQNMTHVFVTAKLSHRWDSPPCLKSVEQQYTLKNSTLRFKNTCLVSNAQIKFFFENRLHKEAKDTLQIKIDGVGTYTLTFEKKQQQIWPFLFESNQKIPIWLQVMNRNTSLKAQFEKLHRQIQLQNQNQPKSDI